MAREKLTRNSPRMIRNDDVECWYYTNGRSIDLFIRRPAVGSVEKIRLFEPHLRRMLVDLTLKRKGRRAVAAKRSKAERAKATAASEAQ